MSVASVDLKPVKNFGHGRRSNLAVKAQQLQKSNQRYRTRSVAVHNITEHKAMMNAHNLAMAQLESSSMVDGNGNRRG